MKVIGDVDYITWKACARVLKYNEDQVAFLAARFDVPLLSIGQEHIRRSGLLPEEISECHGNVLTTAGLNRITALIIGAAGQAMNNAQMLLGVGDTATAATAADTDMGAATGATHRYIQGSDAAFPTQANGVINGQATFTGSNGNHTWNEWAWGVCTGAITPGTGAWSSVGTSPIVVNHKAPAALGTKVTPAVWVLQSSVTLS